MEPRSLERGEACGQRLRIPTFPASMEPRSLERGEERVAAIAAAINSASMEPRSLERGEPPSVVAAFWPACGFNGAALVRARRDVEGGTQSSQESALQWSRAR